MDIVFLFVLIGLAVFGFNRLFRWALNEDHRAGGKTLVDELEQWMKSKHGNREQ